MARKNYFSNLGMQSAQISIWQRGQINNSKFSFDLQVNRYWLIANHLQAIKMEWDRNSQRRRS